MEYGIYNESDIINKSVIDKKCNELNSIANAWRENVEIINRGLPDLTEDVLSVEGKTPVETFTELIEKMNKHASNLDEFAESIRNKVKVIEEEEQAELAQHKKEAEERKKREEEEKKWEKDNRYTDTVSRNSVYSSGGSGNTVCGSSNAMTNTIAY